jgi:hypothetical protein
VLDADGNHLGQITTDYCRQHGLLDWTGDGYQEIIIAYAHGVFDRWGKRIVTFKTKTPGHSILLGDMTGDGISDVTILTAAPATIHIFKNEKGNKTQGTGFLGSGVNFTLY